MKRIGVLTLYYNSLNYGGTLQAYALTRYLGLCGYDASQISFDLRASEAGAGKTAHRIVNRIFDKDTSFSSQLGKYTGMMKSAVGQRLFFKGGFDSRRAAFDDFRERYIPHTKTVYVESNIEEAGADFDAFIVGSDIVWHPYQTDSDVFFLSFVPENKTKIAYAASLGVRQVGSSRNGDYERRLNYLDAVSVRENSAEKCLGALTDKKIRTVLDPSLLLCADNYGSITAPPLLDKPYIFCYLLGGTSSQLAAARRISQQLGLPIAAIPSPGGEYHRADERFGDFNFTDAGPSEFLSLIKNAELILTDSFHAVSYSVIFKKQFLALKRFEDKNAMSLNSRLYDFADMLGLRERVTTSSVADGGFAMLKTDYSEVYKKLDILRARSMEFLNGALK